jgi:phospholipid/cholesterol/gamma-HCH transport system substrate-binding protein
MSISRSQRARLGIFVLIGAVLLGVFMAVPLGFKLIDRYNTFIAFFKGESLSGLEQGAVVKFNGVPIGKVEKITYIPNDLSKVRVEMRIQDDFPMKMDMVATTGAMGITGLKYVEITGGTDTSALRKPGSEIPTKISVIATITGKAEAIAGKVELLLNHLNEISNPDSLESIKLILDNVAAITTDARSFFGEVSPRMSIMAASTQDIIDKVDGIATDVKAFTGTFSSNVSGAQLASIMSRIDSTAVSMKNLSDNLVLMVRQSREDFSVSMENIREASENANQLTKILAENPSLLLKGEAQREREIR